MPNNFLNMGDQIFYMKAKYIGFATFILGIAVLFVYMSSYNNPADQTIDQITDQTGICGDGKCVLPENCNSCAKDCGACSISGKDQLIAFVKQMYTNCHSKGDCEGHGKAITFTTADAVNNIDIARVLDIEHNNIVFNCPLGTMSPPAELGCKKTYEGGGGAVTSRIAPNSTVSSYVFVACQSGNQVCGVEFQKA